MKAVVCRSGKLDVTQIPDLRPGPGQILLDVKRAGICGSDVHLRSSLDYLAQTAAAAGDNALADGDGGIVFGHEFSGEVVDYGPDTHRRWKPGALLVAMPMCRHGRHTHITGASPSAPGSYAEQMLVQEMVAFEVPNGLPAELATLTEPMSVAWHAVRRSQIKKRQTAYVIGCGPVGSAVVALLKAAGVHTVIASDLSPTRRELARRCGADVVVDPNLANPFACAPVPSRTTNVAGVTFPNLPWSVPGDSDEVNVALDAMERLRRFSLIPWWHLFRAMHRFERNPAGPVVFDCAGAPGLLDRLIAGAPPLTRFVVVGSCMQPDTFQPLAAQLKEVDVRFSVGYNPGEFRDVLHMIADGKVDAAPFLTGTVGFSGVEAAFDALDDPERHAKIQIDPHSTVSTV